MPGRGHGRLMSSGSDHTGTPSGINHASTGRGQGMGRGEYFQRGSTTRDNHRGPGDHTNYVSTGPGRPRSQRSTISGRGGRGRPGNSSSSSQPEASPPSGESVGTNLKVDFIYEMPDNSGEVAKDFDEVCDLLHSGRVKISDYLSKKFGFDVTDPENWPGVPKGANLFHDGCFPKFPNWPEDGNPFQLLPLKKSGYFPFDNYGKLVFTTKELNTWYNTRFADEELFEIQFRELTHVMQFNGRWSVDLVVSENGSYGTCKIFSNYPAEKQLEWARAKDSVEPDSGFVTESFDSIVDPLVVDVEVLEPNEFSWEPVHGTGFVQAAACLSQFESDSIVRSQVFDWPYL